MTRHLTLLLLLSAAVWNCLCDNNPGTTQHLQDIFTGRCYDYKQVKYKTVLPQVSEECQALYKQFFQAFSYMAPCSVALSHYLPFMLAAQQQIPSDKALFWSGVRELAHEYAGEGERYVTLEDTMIGYVVDGLVWCGQETTPGMNYSRCPSWSDCPSEASEAFWALASSTFASSTSGTVTVMLDGSRSDTPAYRRDSFFGKYELPAMKKGNVHGVRVFLTHPLDGPVMETCNNGSLPLLQQDVEARGFSFLCVDDPQAILHLLCADNPSDKICHLASAYILHGPQQSSIKAKTTIPFNEKPYRF